MLFFFIKIWSSDSWGWLIFQVVKYRINGHYEVHQDSEGEEAGPCCEDPRAKQRGMVLGMSRAVDVHANVGVTRMFVVFTVSP